MLNFLLGPIYRLLIVLIALVNGGFMLIDGIDNLLTHRYIGGVGGLWARIVRDVGLNPHRIGFVFVLYGVAWLVALFGYRSKADWGWWALVAVSVATLWYIPFGALLSLGCLILLLRRRPRRTRLPGLG